MQTINILNHYHLYWTAFFYFFKKFINLNVLKSNSKQYPYTVQQIIVLYVSVYCAYLFLYLENYIWQSVDTHKKMYKNQMFESNLLVN